jgi:hypothetical protein
MSSNCKGCTFNQNNPFKTCHMSNISAFKDICICGTCIVKANCTAICKERILLYQNYLRGNINDK